MDKNYKVKCISGWGFDLDLYTSEQVEVYGDCFPTTPKNCLRVLWLLESNRVSNLLKETLERWREFDLILTYEEEVLEKCSNASFFVFGTTWVKNPPEVKEFGVTTLVGGKKFYPGHAMRHELVNRQDEITNIPFYIYNSKNWPYIGNSGFRTISDPSVKDELFFTQFHIAIENFTQRHYFTEKIIDCFQAKTIPIYIGAPNICAPFFHPKGVIEVNTVDEIIEVCNNLTPEFYQERLSFVEYNHRLSMPYANQEWRLIREIEYLDIRQKFHNLK